MNNDQLYEIVRYYAPHMKKEPEVLYRDLTLDEAQEHCQSDHTHKEGEWFDGYRRQN